MLDNYFNVYLKPNGKIILKVVKNRNSYKNWKLLFTFVYNEDLKYFQLYDDYIKTIRHDILKKRDSKLKKFIKFIIDL